MEVDNDAFIVIMIWMEIYSGKYESLTLVLWMKSSINYERHCVTKLKSYQFFMDSTSIWKTISYEVMHAPLGIKIIFIVYRVFKSFVMNQGFIL